MPISKVEIYTDGSYKKNNDGGGWAARVDIGGRIKLLSGGEKGSTVNRMEITAVIEALKILDKPHRVQVYSDSQYVVKAFENRWIYRWKKEGWMTSGYKGPVQPIKNKDLWEELFDLVERQEYVQFIWIKGHANGQYPFNELVDEMAQAEADKF